MASTFPAVIEMIQATCFLRGPETALEQRLLLTLSNPGPANRMSLRVVEGSREYELDFGMVPGGRSTSEIFLPAALLETPAVLRLGCGDALSAPFRLTRRPPKRWTVHLVQNSHHDLGYTGLPSRILPLHLRWLEQALEMARATDDYPDPARFRIVIEQAWSLEYFLERASLSSQGNMLARLHEGRFEVNALYANLTTELCSPEELLRALYPAARLKREQGVPILSAEHNDITGFSWGLATALLEAGVRLFVPGLPLYYNWGYSGLESFWDQAAILPGGGPGAFWWQAPTAKRLLVWCGGAGCGGDARASLPGLAETLARLDEQGFPFHCLRWPVTGANSDNSPYRPDYADAAREWNSRWTYPRLVCSTNALFYADLTREDLGGLPVLRGELPGQDYPVGAASTAAANGLTRRTHAALVRAETASALASLVRPAEYPAELLGEAWREMLLHDEHTWGFQFPAGPAGEAARIEKAVRAYRSAALAQDASAKALAALGAAGKEAGTQDGPRILVFNSLGEARSGIVRMPLRPLDNVERVLSPVAGQNAAASYLQVTSLPGRDHLVLPPELLAGHFDLIDLASGARIPYQIEELNDPETPLPYAAARVGLGSGSKRLGLFEVPRGLKLDLVFEAREVPACGYQMYLLRTRPTPARFPNRIGQGRGRFENEFYRISFDNGGLTGLLDKESGRELIDPAAPHPFGGLVLRDPQGGEQVAVVSRVRRGMKGPVSASLEILSSLRGHPRIHQTITLQQGLKQIDLAVNVLKDAEPLLDLHLAFPFALAQPRFRYEGVLAALSPVRDFLPGAQSDRLAVQNWVRVSDGSFSLLWSALDAPVTSLGQLWEGYVSPAHRCLLPESIRQHQRILEQDLRQAWIYSLLFANNFGTNFAPVQSGYALFRYRFSTSAGEVSDEDSAAWGQAAVTELEAALLPGRPGPASASFARLVGARLLAFKRAEDGLGWVLRLWNPSDETRTCRLSLPGWANPRLERIDLFEMGALERLNPSTGEEFEVALEPFGLASLRLK